MDFWNTLKLGMELNDLMEASLQWMMNQNSSICFQLP